MTKEKQDILDQFDTIYNDVLNMGVDVGIDMALIILDNWKDTSIKDERIALMITNGGYAHIPTLKKRLEELKQ